MTRKTALTAATIVALNCVGGAASADVVESVERNIALFDEFMTCSRTLSFEEAGFDTTSTCHHWFREVNDRAPDEEDIVTAGYDCTLDELLMGGHMLWFGDVVYFEEVKDKFEACRQQLASN